MYYKDIEYRFECDYCNDSHWDLEFYGDNLREAQKVLREDGWVISRSRHYMCPSCVKLGCTEEDLIQ